MAPGADAVEIRGDVGVAAWISCAGKPPWVLPDDQRRDDERSLTYDWEPLEDELELLGHPRLRLTLTAPSSGRLSLGEAQRRLRGRRVGTRLARDPQPRPPARTRGSAASRARDSDGRRARARGDVLDLRAGPSRATCARGLRLAEHVAAAARRRARRRSRLRRARAADARRPVADPRAGSPHAAGDHRRLRARTHTGHPSSDGSSAGRTRRVS